MFLQSAEETLALARNVLALATKKSEASLDNTFKLLKGWNGFFLPVAGLTRAEAIQWAELKHGHAKSTVV